MATVTRLEPYITKQELAAYLGCSLRWIDYRIEDGMPHTIIAGRRKFRLSEIEDWLDKRGWKRGERV